MGLVYECYEKHHDSSHNNNGKQKIGYPTERVLLQYGTLAAGNESEERRLSSFFVTIVLPALLYRLEYAHNCCF